MSLRYAIIGAGMMGQEHIRNIALLPGAQVTAIADTDATMRHSAGLLAKQSGFGDAAILEDYRAILSGGVADAVVVASPNDTHRSVMDDLLATQLPVLLEKPSCTTADDAWAIANRANGRQSPIWVAMEYRYMPPVARLVDEVKAGATGNPRMVSIIEHRYPFLQKVGNWNRFNARSGGTMVEKCCHFFDLMRLVTQSEPVRIFASGAQDVNHLDEDHDGATPDILDNALVIVDFANGMRASLDLCMFAEGSYYQEHVSVTGDAGKIEAVVPGPARFWPGGAERVSEIIISSRRDKAPKREAVHVDEEILRAGDHHGGTFFQHEKFANILRHGGKPDVSLRDGAIAVEMGAAAERSIREGIVVHMKGQS
ncbi:Gfo/Idh/MocA family protein [Oricola sp.]|uniref:Gfo/Idh/MocA family protein n=1 Tax=Oricola sp. TaxID=1979950 RepID=UPI003BA9952F